MLTAPVSHSPLVPGQWLDRYKIVHPLARGGMGEVYLATSVGARGFETPVVVKRLPPFSTSANSLSMFIDEAKIGAQLVHPNIARIFDFGENDGAFYLVMEQVEGPSLRQLSRACAQTGVDIPIAVAVQVVLGAAAGLHAAHTACDRNGKALSIVHRDVSPHNIMISANGAVKLIDFGIARFRGKGSRTQTGFVKGKFAYMAPEQCGKGELDARCDIYSLGVVLYELATGRHPYRNRNPAEIVTLLGKDRLPEPIQFIPGFPPELSGIIKKMTEPDPNDRYTSIAEVDRALREFAINADIQLSPLGLSTWMKQAALEVRARRTSKKAEKAGAAHSSKQTNDTQPMNPWKADAKLPQLQVVPPSMPDAAQVPAAERSMEIPVEETMSAEIISEVEEPSETATPEPKPIPQYASTDKIRPIERENSSRRLIFCGFAFGVAIGFALLSSGALG